MSQVIDTQVFDQTIMKLLGKAGLDPRCTPNILRAKAEQKMKLEKDTLVPYRVRMKKLIVKWWKENQSGSGNATREKRPAPSSSDSAHKASAKKVKVEGKPSDEKQLDYLAKYKAFRQYAKALDRADLLAGLTEITEVSDKVRELRKRLHEAGFKHNTPTEADVEEAAKLTAEKKAAAASA